MSQVQVCEEEKACTENAAPSVIWITENEGELCRNDLDAQQVTRITPPLRPRRDVLINKTGSTNGFGAYAAFIPEYARSKGIKLAVLRLFETRDMDGRIERIVVGAIFQQPANPVANVVIGEDQHPRYAAELAAIGVTDGMRNTDPVFFVRGGERGQFNEFLTARMIAPAGPKVIRIAMPADGWEIRVNNNTPIPFKAIAVNFDVDEERHSIEGHLATHR